MQLDCEPRVVEPPSDLLILLNKSKKLKDVWDKLSYTHQKEYVNAVTEAKKEETRKQRLRKIVGVLNKK